VELPNLIEAKAVSLAPPDPMFLQVDGTDNDAATVPDARVVALLQRPTAQGLREYLARLREMNLLDPPEAAEDFLALYEKARFSTTPLLELQFQDLMAAATTLLSSIDKYPASP